MDGMGMLMKSFGIDPEELQAKMGAMINGAMDELTKINAQMQNIQANQKALYTLLRRANVIEDVSVLREDNKSENPKPPLTIVN